jgi:hypothetical protein
MDCVGKAADVIGDFAGCRCSGFDVSFEVKLSIKPDPKPSAGGLDSVVLICDRCDSKGGVYNAGRGVVIPLLGEVHHFQLFWCKGNFVCCPPLVDSSDVFCQQADVFIQRVGGPV